MINRLSVLILSVLCSALQAQTSSAESDIRAARRASNDAIRNHDIATFSASLSADLIVISGDGTFIPSRQAYIDLFVQDFADPRSIRFERIPDKVEISATGLLAAEHGHWIGTRPDGSRVIGGTYLAMWRAIGRRWTIRSELFVTLQ